MFQVRVYSISELRLNSVLSSLVAALNLAAIQATYAATPDAGRLLEETRPIVTPAPQNQSKPPVLENSTATPTPSVPKAPQYTIEVKAFRFKGNEAIDGDTLNALVQPYINKQLSFEELQNVLDEIKHFYQKQGYFVAYPYLPEQDIVNGVITIAILEGHIDKAFVTPTNGSSLKLKDSVLKPRLDTLSGSTIQQNTLERSLLLLNDLSGVQRATGRLSPGDATGTSHLDIALEPEPKLWTAKIESDNYGSRYTGNLRAGASLRALNVGGYGGELGLQTQFAEGLSMFRLNGSQALDHHGLKLTGSASHVRYRLCCGLGISGNGDADELTLGLNYPVIRQQYRNLTLGIEATRRDLTNEIANINISDKRIQSIALNTSGDYTIIPQKAWVAGIASLSMGNLNLDGNPADQTNDSNAAQAAGNYTKLSYNFAANIEFQPQWSLYTNLNGQLASKNLDSSEQISLGGPHGVRSYPTGEASGDEGHIINLEMRYRPLSNLQLAFFYDHGLIKLHHTPWQPDTNKNFYMLQSAGLSLRYLYVPTQTEFALAWAHSIGSNPGASIFGTNVDGRALKDRFWFDINQLF